VRWAEDGDDADPGRRALLGLAVTAAMLAASGCAGSGSVAGADGRPVRGTGSAGSGPAGAGSSGAGSSGAGSAAGSSGSGAQAGSASTDLQAATRAARSARQLLTAASGTGRAAGLAALLAKVAQDHQQHLERLGIALPTTDPSASGSAAATTPAASGSTTAAASGSPAATSPAAAPAATLPSATTLAQGEAAAAQAALADVPLVSPGLAALLAQVAASRTVHADLITTAAGAAAPDPVTVPAAPAGLSAATTSAVNRLLAGEHAAVFAYGLVTARTNGSVKARARSMWRFHQGQRDVLEQALLTAGLRPPAAQPAYDLGATASADGSPASLAATVESGLAGIAVWAVSTTSGADRAWAANQLVAAARRTAAWTGRPLPFPGTSKPTG